MTTIDLSQLPAPAVVEEIDFETILAERKAEFLARYPEAEEEIDLESSALAKMLEENAYREVGWRQRVNEAARAVLLAFSSGSDLDQVAANLETERLLTDPGDPDANPPVEPTYESDKDLRQRAQSAFEGLSVAGPRSAYVVHALSADGRVADATATSPNPAEALVTILSREGDGTAAQDLLDAVEADLSAEDVRPVADRLTVQSAEIVDYAVDATLYIYPGPEAEPILDEANARLDAYTEEQRRLGRDIRRSALHAALHAEGVQRVDLNSPAADIVLDETQAAHCTAKTAVVGGTDE